MDSWCRLALWVAPALVLEMGGDASSAFVAWFSTLLVVVVAKVWLDQE